MGVFTSKLRILNPAEPARAAELELTVDTGASYSWVSRSHLAALGIRPTDRMQFRTIEGKLIEREVAPVFLQIDGRIGGDTVVVGEPGDMEVMGAHSLGALGMAVDPVQKKLVRTVGYALTVAARNRQVRVGENQFEKSIRSLAKE
jgi:predicted aspartyl protease